MQRAQAEATGMADHALKSAVIAPLLHTVVVEVGDVECAGLIEGQAGRRVELPGRRSGTPEIEEEFARCRELLNAVLLVVGDVNGAIATDGDAHRISELPPAVTFAAPLCQEFTGRAESHDAQPCVGHIDVARRCNRNADRPLEASARKSLAVPRCLERVLRVR